MRKNKDGKKDPKFTFKISVQDLLHAIKIMHSSGQKVAHLRIIEGVSMLIGSKSNISLDAYAEGTCDVTLHLAKLTQVLKTYIDKDVDFVITQDGVSCLSLHAPLCWL